MGDERELASAGAAQLVKALERVGWSQQELEARIGAPSGLVSRWLSGQRRPGLEFAFKIERLLKIPASSWLRAA